jgi:hypothetical protein
MLTLRQPEILVVTILIALSCWLPSLETAGVVVGGRLMRPAVAPAPETIACGRWIYESAERPSRCYWEAAKEVSYSFLI